MIFFTLQSFFLLFILLSFLLTPSSSLSIPIKNPEEYTNLLAGSFTDGNQFSTGNTLPLVARPWGFNHWTVQTRGSNSGSWFFNGNDNDFVGFRCTHQPSPWIGDWAYFNFYPNFYSNLSSNNNNKYLHPYNSKNKMAHYHISSSHIKQYWQPRAATMKPYLLSTFLAPYNIKMKLTPTNHGAIVKIIFTAVDQLNTQTDSPSICFNNINQFTSKQFTYRRGKDSVFFSSPSSSSFSSPYFSSQDEYSGIEVDGIVVSPIKEGYQNYNTKLYIKILATDAISSNDNCIIFSKAKKSTTRRITSHVDDDEEMEDNKILIDDDELNKNTFEYEIRIATSLISTEQAEISLQNQLPLDKSFKQILKESKLIWNHLLKRVEIDQTHEESGIIKENFSRENAKNIEEMMSKLKNEEVEDEEKYEEKLNKLVSNLDENHRQFYSFVSNFYNSLYRSLLFPRFLTEYDKSGKAHHFSPYNSYGQIFDGDLVTDNGFWDTFRTVYPMLNLIYPDYAGRIIQGWLNAYKEGEWLPTWASPGYRNCMVGTFADAVISDAIVKDIKGFDLDLAIEAVIKDVTVRPPQNRGNSVGRKDIDLYTRLGYLPSEIHESVSISLDFGYADYSIAKAFLYLLDVKKYDGKHKSTIKKLSEELYNRSLIPFTKLFDSNYGLMVPKTSQGISTSFSPATWGNGFVEGNSWHHSFPPYAISCVDEDEGIEGESGKLRGYLSNIVGSKKFTCDEGLAGLYGGKEELVKKLKELVRTNSNFSPGSYGRDIHEMKEARAFSMGQYAHNNQPSHHILHLFALLGEGETTNFLVKKVLKTAYGADFYSGDEDNGEMSSWYVLSSLGLFSVTSGTKYYVPSIPIFSEVKLYRDFKKKFDISLFSTSTDKSSSKTWFSSTTSSSISSDDSNHYEFFSILNNINNKRLSNLEESNEYVSKLTLFNELIREKKNNLYLTISVKNKKFSLKTNQNNKIKNIVLITPTSSSTPGKRKSTDNYLKRISLDEINEATELIYYLDNEKDQSDEDLILKHFQSENHIDKETVSHKSPSIEDIEAEKQEVIDQIEAKDEEIKQNEKKYEEEVEDLKQKLLFEKQQQEAEKKRIMLKYEEEITKIKTQNEKIVQQIALDHEKNLSQNEEIVEMSEKERINDKSATKNLLKIHEEIIKSKEKDIKHMEDLANFYRSFLLIILFLLLTFTLTYILFFSSSSNTRAFFSTIFSKSSTLPVYKPRNL